MQQQQQTYECTVAQPPERTYVVRATRVQHFRCISTVVQLGPGRESSCRTHLEKLLIRSRALSLLWLCAELCVPTGARYTRTEPPDARPQVRKWLLGPREKILREPLLVSGRSAIL